MQTRRIPRLTETTRGLIASGDRTRLNTLFASLHPWDAARVTTSLTREEQEQLLLLLGPETAADVVEELEDPRAAELISKLPVDRASHILDQMESDKGADLLQTLPQKTSRQILEKMRAEEREEALELLTYPPHTAGGLMMKEFIAVDQNRSVGDLVQELRVNAQKYKAYRISYIYVVDGGQRLVGVLPLRDLLLGGSDTRIRDLMIQDVVRVPADMDREEVARLFEQYHYLAIPVVDASNRILGIVTQDDALEVVEREASEDLLKFSGIVGGEETYDTPFFRRSGRRLAWLGVNIVLNLVSASVIWAYEDILLAMIGLAMFLPIISDMSGCSGNQAVAVAIRELARGRIGPRDFWRMWWGEVRLGLFNGFILGAQLGGIAWILREWRVGLIVGFALWVNTVVSLMVGSAVPLLLNRFGKDPALASAPILTTLTDFAGFLLTLSLASLFV